MKNMREKYERLLLFYKVDKKIFISSRLRQLIQSDGSSYPFLAIFIPKSIW